MKSGHTAEYWKGVEQGMKHAEPSPETIKRITALEEKMSTLATKEDIHEMKKAFEDFTKAVGALKIGGKVGYRVLLVLATIVVSVVAIGGGFKTIVGWFIK